MARLNYESRIEQAKQKIRSKPEAALKEIGKFLTKEIRAVTPRGLSRKVKTKSGRIVTIKPGRLRKSVGYWYKKKEGQLQIGFKAFYAPHVILGTKDNPGDNFFMREINKNKNVVQDMIKDALKELNKE